MVTIDQIEEDTIKSNLEAVSQFVNEPHRQNLQMSSSKFFVDIDKDFEKSHIKEGV